VNKKENWTDSKIGGGLAAAYSLAMISPLNEVLRLGMLAASEVITHGDKISNAAVLGLSTLFVEGSSGLVVSDLLSSNRAETIRQAIFTSKRGEKLRESDKSNLAIELGAGLFAGTPVALLTREFRSPKQSRTERRKYSIAMSLGTAAVVGGLFYGAEEGLGVNATLELGGSIIGAGIIYSVIKAYKNRGSKK